MKAGKSEGKPVEGVTVTVAQPDTGKNIEDMPKRSATAVKPPPAKKQKTKASKGEVEPDQNGVYPPGYGPLPPNSVDGFDERLILNPDTGKLEYKTEAQMNATKTMTRAPAATDVLKIWTDGSSLGNGQLGSTAGIGVYFGPGDSRYAFIPLHHDNSMLTSRVQQHICPTTSNTTPNQPTCRTRSSPART